MNLQITQQEREEQVLNNYIALWRHIVGDERLKVQNKFRQSLAPELKQL